MGINSKLSSLFYGICDFRLFQKMIGFAGLITLLGTGVNAQNSLPNILFVISDDQSFPHASAYGSDFIETPAFDSIAEEGVLFTNAFAPSPGCSPSRASILTGRYPWQNEEAGTHASSFPGYLSVFPDILEEAGYFIGYSGKGWGPGDWQVSGRDRNPAGPAYQERSLTSPNQFIGENDYSGNFELFLEKRPEKKPFFFWMGTYEPHRPYLEGSGMEDGKRAENVDVPDYLPDTPEVRSDFLDYALEIEWFDQHLAKALNFLKETNELANTLIIVTSDNGMPFPRAKANLYEDGIHVPLAIRWDKEIPENRIISDLVSLIDLMPTMLDAAGVEYSDLSMTGRSLMNILKSDKEGFVDTSRDAIYSSRERHSSSRWHHLSFPQRAIRTQQYLYIRNFKPERWPAGTPRRFDEGELTPMHSGYHDIDSSPTLDVLTENAHNPNYQIFLHMSVAKRPSEELYDILKDPDCIHNLALDVNYESVVQNFRNRLNRFLTETGDPRAVADGEIWETYPRLRGPMREFPSPIWRSDQ